MATQPLPPRALWVLDCWLNVACEASAYMRRIAVAIKHWNEQGKGVWGVYFDMNMLRFDARGYAGSFVHAPLAYNRVWQRSARRLPATKPNPELPAAQMSPERGFRRHEQRAHVSGALADERLVTTSVSR